MAFYNWKSTEQRQVALSVGATDIFGKGQFKARLPQPFLKFLELILGSHFSNTKDVRMNFFDDPNQDTFFALRLRPQNGFPSFAAVHLQIVFDVVMSENHRFLADGHCRPAEEIEQGKKSSLQCRHKKKPGLAR